MIRLRHKLLIYALRVFDQVVLALVLGGVIDLVGLMGGKARLVDVFRSSYKPVDSIGIAVLGVGWLLMFNAFVCYDTHRFRALRPQIADLIKATTGAAFLLLVLSAIFSFSRVNNTIIAIFWCVSSGVGILSRLLIHWFLIVARRSGYNYRHLLIVGSNERALQTANRLDASRALGYKIVGFVVEHPWQELSDEESQIGGRWPVVGSLPDLKAILERGTVDEVMVCLPVVEQFSTIHHILKLAQEIGVVVRLFPEEADVRLMSRGQVERFEGDYVITLFRERLLLQLLIKRAADVIVSFVALVVLSPLLVLVALVIKLTSPGSVLFVQERIGMNKRRFNLYKFRSMVMDAEQRKQELTAQNEMDGPVFKIKNDPRMTPIGRFLRRSSIDELPQLFNVLAGQMSLVGPRPPLPEEVDRYDWLYRKRLSIKPGITCLWQVSGRNQISFQRWMELDRQYVENWSLWLDVKILFRTIPVVFLGKGAS